MMMIFMIIYYTWVTIAMSTFIDFSSLFVRVPTPFNLFGFDLYTVIKCDGFVGTTTQFPNRWS